MRNLEILPFGNDLYHVYDHRSSRHFKLGGEEIAWLRSIDGSRTIEDLRDVIPREHFDDFFTLLKRLELFEGPAPKKKFDPIKIKFRAVRPNAWLERKKSLAVLYRQLLSLFTLPLFVINVLLLLIAAPQLQHASTSLRFGWVTVAFYACSVLLIGFVHEFSHALVAKSRGANVVGIGFMFFYFTPAFYADVSGVSLLNNRAHRIETFLAGIQANNALVTVLLFVFFLARDTALAPLLLLPIALNVFMVIWNLVPFVEFDGYYVLTELFGDPNLGSNSKRVVLEKAHRRPEYVFYFLLSQLFSVSIVLSAVLALRSLVERFVRLPAFDYATVGLMLVALIVLNVRNARKWPHPVARAA